MKNLVFRSLDSVERAMALSCRAERGHAERSDLAESWARTGDEALWAAARRNRILPHMAHALQESLPAGTIPERWQDAHSEATARLDAYMAEVDAIADRAHRVGIAVVGLKNVGIARALHPCRGCCPMGDVDLLVRKDQFYAACALLTELGFSLASRHPRDRGRTLDLQGAYRSGGAEFTKSLGEMGILWCEVQWRPVAGRWLRPEKEPDGTTLVERSVAIPGTRLRLLQPQDNLLQVCLHTAKHTYLRPPGFRLHTDVDRITRRCEINWDAFCDEVEDRRVKVAVWLSLAIPSQMLDSPVPASVLERLGQSKRRLHVMSEWLRRAGMFDCDSHKFGKAEYIAFCCALFDDFGSLGSAIVPPTAWMMENYDFKSAVLLPGFHVKRWADLLLNRWL